MRTPGSSTVLQQLARFALVGGVGFVVDTACFDLLLLTPAFAHHPVTSGVISTVLAIAANWIGNRYWTFGPHRSTRNLLEAVEFGAVSVLGMLVALGCLAVSHYVLELRSVLADTIAKNVVGLVLGSALRFLLYRHWVYHPGRRDRVARTGRPEGDGATARAR